MPSRAITPTPKTYAQLREAVIAVVVQGRQAIDRAWLETYHETGRLINEHVLLFKDRADHGAKIYQKLSADTDISERSLRQCAQFHRCYPIWHGRAKLIWSHYQLLIQIADPARRTALETEAIRKNWTATDLETRVRSYNAVALASGDDVATPAEPIELLTPRLGTPDLRLVVDRPAGLGLDLGFKSYGDLTPEQQKRLGKGDIVRCDDSGVRKIPDARKTDLFTYVATVRRVIDGDTLDLAVRLAPAPGFTRDLKVRLRDLDCPEISTAAGQAAKAFVDALLKPGDEIIICTTKPDKYDRYLADVFIRAAVSDQLEAVSPESDAGQKLNALNLPPTAKKFVFLNNALLSARHAIRYDGGAKEE